MGHVQLCQLLSPELLAVVSDLRGEGSGLGESRQEMAAEDHAVDDINILQYPYMGPLSYGKDYGIYSIIWEMQDLYHQTYPLSLF